MAYLGESELNDTGGVAVVGVELQLSLPVKLTLPVLDAVRDNVEVGGDLDGRHLHVVLIAGLDLDRSVPQEGKFSRVSNINLEGVPVRAHRGWTGDVGVTVDGNLQSHLKPNSSF